MNQEILPLGDSKDISALTGTTCCISSLGPRLAGLSVLLNNRSFPRALPHCPGLMFALGQNTSHTALLLVLQRKLVKSLQKKILFCYDQRDQQMAHQWVIVGNHLHGEHCPFTSPLSSPSCKMWVKGDFCDPLSGYPFPPSTQIWFKET